MNDNLNKLLDLAEGSNLSSIRSVVVEITQIVKEPTTGVAPLKKVVECDPPLSARVLRRANSALYGFRRQISSIQEAIICIGFDSVKELALSQKIGELFERSGNTYGYSRRLLWKHSVAVGLCCKLLHRREFRERGERSYAAGLLHDLGLIVEEEAMPDLFRKLLRKAHDEKRNLCDVEREELGYTHADIVAGLADRWGLPAKLVEAVRGHHEPEFSGEQAQLRSNLALFAANAACQARSLGFGDAPLLDADEWEQAMAGLGVSSMAFDLIADEVIKQLELMEADGWF